LRQVLDEDPVPPLRLNPAIPRDLDTVCLKCLQKEPLRRYASAAALAEDLQRFLRGELIAARRAGPLERLARWARRSPAAAALVAITLFVAITVLGAGSWLIGRQIVTARAVEADLREANRLQQQSAFPEAGAALQRARSRLGDGGPFWLYPAVEAARRDHQFLVRLEAIRLNRSTLVEGEQGHGALLRFLNARADRDYVEAFRDHGLGEPRNDPEGVVARVRASRWAAHIIAALDDWAVCTVDRARQDWLLDVGRGADPDPWRDRVRDPEAWRHGKELAELAREAPLAEQPVPLLLAVGERLSATGQDGVTFLRRVREQHPDDFWSNLTLGLALHGAGRRSGGDPAPALAYFDKALEIRPRAVAVLNDLGVTMYCRNLMGDNERESGRPGALTVFHQVVRNDPRFAPGHNNLGLAIKARGDWDLAMLMYRDALGIDPRLAPAHLNLGTIRAGSGFFGQAINHYRQALAVDPDCACAHHLLGLTLLAKGRRDELDEDYPAGVKPLEHARGRALGEAVACYWQAYRCDPAWAPARNPLRIPPQDEARLREAIGHYRQAVRLEAQIGVFHGALGQALLAQHEFIGAEDELRRSVELVPEADEQLRRNLDRLLRCCQHLRVLEGRLPAVVQGKDKPAAADCLDLAELCFVKKHYAAAARLYAKALAATPQLTEDLRAGHRFNAACAAVLAGAGHGDDAAGLGDTERAGLRKQARDWLRLDLVAWAKTVDTGTAADRIQAQKTLAPWRDYPGLAGLRDPAAVDRLPSSERQECRALWRDFDTLLERAHGPGK
jgi:serine/threonine-protein kinase